MTLTWVLRNRGLTLAGFLLILGGAALGARQIGQDFFPSVDAGQIRLHVRCAPGTRIESSEQQFLAIEDAIREFIPPGDLALVLDNIGLPPGGVNLAFSDSSTVSAADGEILISLKPGRAKGTLEHVRTLRAKLPERFPTTSFFFQSADIVSQILNFGLAAPIDVQVSGPSREENLKLAQAMVEKFNRVPGAVDVHLQQVPAAPEIRVAVDRTRALQVGLTQRDVASSMLTSLSGSAQAAPNYWLNPKNGVNYLIAVQTPPYRLTEMDDLQSTPLTSASGGQQLLEEVATVSRSSTPVAISHYNVQPVYDVLVSVDGSDLGKVGGDVQKIVDETAKNASKGVSIKLIGQFLSMKTSYTGLALGLLAAITLVYFLMVVNFQSWTDPLIIIFAVPGALAGVVAALLLTGTNLSVPALMGTIMCVGVATSNSILMVTFANDQRREASMDALGAAFSAGRVRLRPVMMTAAAMIIGMVPMSLGLGEGGEQNAPLGRAVIGGLVVATFATLLVVPVIYSLLRRQMPHGIEDFEREVANA